MQFLEKIKTVTSTIQATTDAVGKTVWIVIVGFVGIAIASGHPSLLETIRNRLLHAGFTSLNTPLGAVDLNRIGKSSEVLGLNAARAADLAATIKDPAAKEQLDAITKDLSKQQQQQIDQLAAISSSQRNFTATSRSSSSKTWELWIYVGRYSSGRWLPPSFSIKEPKYPVNLNKEIVVKNDAILYSDVDCKRTDISGLLNDESSRGYSSFVSAGPEGIPLTGEVLQCDSVGGAKTVWAQVSVPSSRFIKVR